MPVTMPVTPLMTDNSTPPSGLTQAEASERLRRSGRNEIPDTGHTSLWVIFLRQFKSSFIYILLIAAIVSAALDHTLNSIFIILVLLLNATIRTIQEYAAEHAASSLKRWCHTVPLSSVMAYR